MTTREVFDFFSFDSPRLVSISSMLKQKYIQVINRVNYINECNYVKVVSKDLSSVKYLAVNGLLQELSNS